MQAVILCAGKGTRMGELTRNTPKPLLGISGKSLLEHKLERLPKAINEIVLIVGYLGDQIREKIGNEYQGRPVHYVEDTTLTGTAHALWQAKDILRGRFLVMMGDDIYSTEAQEKCAKHDFSLACIKADRETTGSRVVTDENGRPTGFETHLLYIRNHADGGLIFTGLYSMTTEIFNHEPVKMETKDEWSLPQTFLKLGQTHDIKIIETDFWLSITAPEDLVRAVPALKPELG